MLLLEKQFVLYTSSNRMHNNCKKGGRCRCLDGYDKELYEMSVARE